MKSGNTSTSKHEDELMPNRTSVPTVKLNEKAPTKGSAGTSGSPSGGAPSGTVTQPPGGHYR